MACRSSAFHIVRQRSTESSPRYSSDCIWIAAVPAFFSPTLPIIPRSPRPQASPCNSQVIRTSDNSFPGVGSHAASTVNSSTVSVELARCRFSPRAAPEPGALQCASAPIPKSSCLNSNNSVALDLAARENSVAPVTHILLHPHRIFGFPSPQFSILIFELCTTVIVPMQTLILTLSSTSVTISHDRVKAVVCDTGQPAPE